MAKSVKKPINKVVLIVLLIVLAFFQYQLWISKDGIIGIWHLKKDIALQTEKNSELRLKNNNLRADVLELKKGGAAVEEHARNELGMIKQGEIFYRTVTK